MRTLNLKRMACQAVMAGALGVTLAAVSANAQAGDDSTWQSVRQEGVLRCGAAVAAPYVMRDPRTEAYSGFFVDICRGFAEDVLKVKPEFSNTTWGNLVAGLQGGQWDMAMALNQTPERMKAVDFSDAVTDYQVSFVTNRNNPKTRDVGNSLEDLDKEGVTFAVMSGTAQDKAISPEIRNARVMRLPGMDETRLALMSRRADVLVDASDSNHLFALANEDWSREIIPEPALAKQPVSFGLRKGTSEADLKVLNDYIASLHEKNEIQRLIDKASQEVIKSQ